VVTGIITASRNGTARYRAAWALAAAFSTLRHEATVGGEALDHKPSADGELTAVERRKGEFALGQVGAAVRGSAGWCAGGAMSTKCVARWRSAPCWSPHAHARIRRSTRPRPSRAGVRCRDRSGLEAYRVGADLPTARATQRRDGSRISGRAPRRWSRIGALGRRLCRVVVDEESDQAADAAALIAVNTSRAGDRLDADALQPGASQVGTIARKTIAFVYLEGDKAAANAALDGRRSNPPPVRNQPGDRGHRGTAGPHRDYNLAADQYTIYTTLSAARLSLGLAGRSQGPGEQGARRRRPTSAAALA